MGVLGRNEYCVAAVLVDIPRFSFPFFRSQKRLFRSQKSFSQPKNIPREKKTGEGPRIRGVPVAGMGAHRKRKARGP